MLHNLPTTVTVKDALDAYFKIKCDLLSNYESDNDDDETVVKCDGGVKKTDDNDIVVKGENQCSCYKRIRECKSLGKRSIFK